MYHRYSDRLTETESPSGSVLSADRYQRLRFSEGSLRCDGTAAQRRYEVSPGRKTRAAYEKIRAAGAATTRRCGGTVFPELGGGMSFSIYAFRANTKPIPEKTCSSFAFGNCPTRSIRRSLSIVMICETFAAQFFGNPVAVAGRCTFPGISAHFTLPVRGTQTTVAMRLLFKEFACTMMTGLR